MSGGADGIDASGAAGAGGGGCRLTGGDGTGNGLGALCEVAQAKDAVNRAIAPINFTTCARRAIIGADCTGFRSRVHSLNADDLGGYGASLP